METQNYKFTLGLITLWSNIEIINVYRYCHKTCNNEKWKPDHIVFIDIQYFDCWRWTSEQ